MDKPRDLYTLGLNICGASMLAALVTGAWGYFLGGSTSLLVAVAIIAVVGCGGIALLTFDFYKKGQR
jgi:hypothetical protein